MATESNYATDGVCHNSEPGWFNQECGKAAAWIGGKEGFEMGFCEACRRDGWEASAFRTWRPVGLRCVGGIG